MIYSTRNTKVEARQLPLTGNPARMQEENSEIAEWIESLRYKVKDVGSNYIDIMGFPHVRAGDYVVWVKEAELFVLNSFAFNTLFKEI